MVNSVYVLLLAANSDVMSTGGGEGFPGSLHTYKFTSVLGRVGREANATILQMEKLRPKLGREVGVLASSLRLHPVPTSQPTSEAHLGI
jgi:hypothetical protein